MNLKSIHLNRIDWGDQAGQLNGTLTVEGKHGEVTINVNDEQARKIVATVADALVETTKTVAASITAELLIHDQGNLLGVDDEGA